MRAAILAVLLISLSGWLYLEHTDPRYNGRCTSEWLLALESESDAEKKDAEHAISMLGESAIPQVTRFFYAHDPQWKEEVYDWVSAKANWELNGVKAYKYQSAGESAVDILGERAAPMIPRLIEALGDEEFDSASLGALSSIGKPAINPLKSALNHKNPKIQVAAIYLLTELDQKDILPVLKRNLDSNHSEVRGISLVASAKLSVSQGDLLPLIRKMAQDKQPEVRAEAVNLLGILAETNHTLIPEFAGHAKDSSPYVRERVAIRVWRFCPLDPAAIDALKLALGDVDVNIRGLSYFSLLVTLGEIPRHRVIEQREWGPWWSAGLLPEVPFKPLINSSDAIFQSAAQLKVILAKEAGNTLPSATQVGDWWLKGGLILEPWPAVLYCI